MVDPSVLAWDRGDGWVRAHFVGIAGAAMTPLATILLQRGVAVSGSDLQTSPAMVRLEALGATVAIGHRADHVGDVDVVIISSAVPATNPEVVEAQARGIPVLKHAEALAAVMRGHYAVAVAGTHGKTTTSALVAVLLTEAGLNPTFHVGSELLNYGCHGRSGRPELIVVEADEYDRRFLAYQPSTAIITSLEPDHLDYFGDFAAVQSAFAAFVDRVHPNGTLILCSDAATVRALPTGARRVVTYGTRADADWQVVACTPQSSTTSAVELRAPDGTGRRLVVRLLGHHNATNVAAAVAVATELGVAWADVERGVAAFAGTRRRFEVVGNPQGITVVDDYAHHPTAVRVTLEAARAHFSGAIWVVYQPHTAHRTESLQDEFRTCFDAADHVVLTPTYRPAGREEDDDDASVRQLVAAMAHRDVRLLSPADATRAIAIAARAGDLVLVMGAGDIWSIERPLIDLLAARDA